MHAGHIKPYCLFIVHVDFEIFVEPWPKQIIAQALAGRMKEGAFKREYSADRVRPLHADAGWCDAYERPASRIDGADDRPVERSIT
jgi:hypothetical protein